MKIIEISSTMYKWEKLAEYNKNLGKGIPYIILAKNGKRILITHGNKSGKIQLENEYKGLYDEILCCWKDTNEKNWIGYNYCVEMDENKNKYYRYFLIQAPTSELELMNNRDYILQSIQSGIVE